MTPEFLDKIPPSDKAAERSVLGGILRDPDTLGTVQQFLRATDFYFDHHQKIYQSIEIGAAANAGWIRGGSAEISKSLFLGGQEREGPILTAMTLHGEQRVALDEETRLPPAVFADGYRVPPATSMARWLEAMMGLSAKNPTDPEPAR